jgi:diamine N-acetyltransferase
MRTAAVLALRVTAQQEQFVGSVHDALQDALEYPDAKPWYRAIYADDEPVGFLHSPTPKQLS